MVGWFWSGLLQSFFLYLYVLGHELTHVLFVVIFRGQVTDFHVSTQGGYITTNKTNLVIALSPYFVPFWAVICAMPVCGAAPGRGSDTRLGPGVLRGDRRDLDVPHGVDLVDDSARPAGSEGKRHLSLAGGDLSWRICWCWWRLLCVAAESPLHETREFAMEWLRQAATWGDQLWRWRLQAIAEFRAAGKF